MTINNLALRQARPVQFSHTLDIKIPVEFMEKVLHWWNGFRGVDENLERDMSIASISLVTMTMKRVG